MKLELLTNATVVDDAIRFVSQKSKENLKSASGKCDKESNGPDYDEDKNQLEGKQEEQTGEIAATINQVF
jgi:uncharacterized protein YjbJ (UPF0337 family)